MRHVRVGSALVVVVVACGPRVEVADELATTSGAVAPPTSSGTPMSTTSSSTSVSSSTFGGSESTSTSGFESGSTSSFTSGTGSDGVEWSDCGARGEGGGAGERCYDIELVNVDVDVLTNRIAGHDVPAAFDLEEGSQACVRIDDGWVRMYMTLAPFESGEPCTTISLDVGDGARMYDLATDPGPPGTGNRGLLGLGNAYQNTSTETWSYSTINQAGVGWVDVVSLPVDGETQLEFAALGSIANPNGWEFDFRVTATVPVQ